MNKALLSSAFLAGICLVGLFVMFCGIGLSFGLRRLSLFGFFSALLTLGILRLILWLMKNDPSRDRDPSA